MAVAEATGRGKALLEKTVPAVTGDRHCVLAKHLGPQLGVHHALHQCGAVVERQHVRPARQPFLADLHHQVQKLQRMRLVGNRRINRNAQPFCSYIFDLHQLTKTFVSPPRVRLMSMLGPLVCHEPAVKSGTPIEFDRLSTDHSLNGTIELHAAAS